MNLPFTPDPVSMYRQLQEALRELCTKAPAYGSISLKVELHNGQVTRISTGTEASFKVAPSTQSNREKVA